MNKDEMREKLKEALSGLFEGAGIEIQTAEDFQKNVERMERNKERDRVTNEKFAEAKVPGSRILGYHMLLDTISQRANVGDFVSSLIWLADHQDNLQAAKLALAVMEWALYSANVLNDVDKTIGTRIIDGNESLMKGYADDIAKGRALVAKIEAKYALEASLQSTH